MVSGEFQEAVLTLEPVARRLERAGREKERARTELYLGFAFVELSRPDQAREQFARALALDGSIRLPVGGCSPRATALFGDVRRALEARP
jgi:hypothetical protein